MSRYPPDRIRYGGITTSGNSRRNSGTVRLYPSYVSEHVIHLPIPLISSPLMPRGRSSETPGGTIEQVNRIRCRSINHICRIPSITRITDPGNVIENSRRDSRTTYRHAHRRNPCSTYHDMPYGTDSGNQDIPPGLRDKILRIFHVLSRSFPCFPVGRNLRTRFESPDEIR